MDKKDFSIFCVDDDRINGVILDKILADFNCTLLDSGQACLTELEKQEPDLILLDIEMPDLNGMDTCQQIREKGFTNTPIMFLSGNDSVEERLKGYRYGGDDFLSKPFDVKELLAKVNTALTKKSLLDQANKAVKDSTESMSNVMKTLGETGVVIHFLQATFDCKSYAALAQQIIIAHKQLGLDVSIEFIVDGEYQYHNLTNSLEQSVFEYTRKRGRIVSFGERTIVNYPHVSIFIQNMPTADPDLNGRIRDYIALIGQGAESKLKTLDTEFLVQSQREGLVNFISELGQTVNEIDARYIHQQNLNEGILSDLVDEIEESFVALEMTESQEGNLRKIIQRADQRTKVLNDTGLTIANEFTLILEKVTSVIEESHAETVEEEEEEEDDIFSDQDDDGTLLF